MNRLALVPCLVVASYVAVASYIASPIVYDLGRSRVALKIPTSVANREEIDEDSSSRTKQTSSVHPSNEVPNKPLATIEKPAAAVLPETPYHESTWVMVLLPPGFILVLRLTLRPAIFTRLEHRSAPPAISTTGSKLSNQAPRKRAGSIENT